ncbi:MAG: (Fe-S)-binding protein [Nocardioides sp.]|uniref:(Fe-S)-binding protein n=1 Tax=Nocardioides sp. TaxID=35761 RepID=UPI0039E541AC
MVQTIAIVVALVLTVVTVYLVARAVLGMVGVLRIGSPVSRSDHPGRRTVTMLKETFGHTRMFQWRWVGVMHWFVYFGFLILSSAVATGFVQLFDPKWQLPIIGHWFVFEWVQEGIGVLSTIGIVYLIVYRQRHKPAQLGRGSRFFGSTFWQAYFVEFMALLEGVAILFIRGAEQKYERLHALEGHADPDKATNFHYPVAHLFGGLYGDSEHALKSAIIVIALVKVASALVWLDVIALNLTMGVAWHRFTAWFNIWFKREADGRTALGAIKPLTSAGKAVALDDIDDLDEDATLGVGTIQDFSWKGILDFTTCTECGRCQSQCPAWNTEKPLSPKLLVMGLREHAYAAAPYLAGDGEPEAGTPAAKALIGTSEADAAVGAGPEVTDWFYNPEGADFVIDSDVLWSCTSCGACVQQCPVDIEHVDHIMDMRRYQVLVESNFPAELNGLFRGLENNGNPWNMSSRQRMDWAKDLPFEVKVVGEDIESLDEVDWLFWVGCAGAYEDRAKKTTRAVAELLDLAGVSFGVLGNGETCTGDSARRAGNEFVFQGLANANVETFKEFKVKKAVTTCAHCFNTLKNEYKEFGIELEVVHHTQLLNRLVREGRLTPVASGSGAHQRSITYHDPCYLGRHNGVYTPPRELLQVLPGAEYKEMPRNSERSFCCGAGGARMWMEENLGSRINRNRTDEAVATGADQIAVGCPFCRVMLSDGLTAAQASGTAREEVEVLDVAQMLLASVKGEQATKLAPGAGTTTTPAPSTPAEPAASAAPTAPAETVAPAETGTGGSSLFDTPATETPADASSLFDTPAPAEATGGSLFDTPAPSEEAPSGGAGSLFDVGGSLFDTPSEPSEPPEPAQPADETADRPRIDLGAGGSLFDVQADEPAEPAPPAQDAAGEQETAQTPVDLTGSLFDVPVQEPSAPPAPPQAAAPTVDLGAGGSLFDIPAEPAPESAPEPAPPSVPEPATESTTPAAPEPVPEPVPSEVDLGSVGSLFDIQAPPEPAAPVQPTEPPTTAPAATEAATETADETATETADATETAAPESPEPSDPSTTTAPAPAVDSGAAPVVRTDVDIASVGSLFDIAAPDSTVTAHPVEPVEPVEAAEAAEAPVAEPTSADPADPDEVATEAATEAVDPGEEDDTAPPAPVATPEPTASGEAHTPRTDVDINAADSLFDL